VVADLVWSERPHHVPTPALLEYPCLFADNFESSADSEPREIARDIQRGIIGRGLDVVFGVEPQDDVDGPGGMEGSRYQREEEQSNSHISPRSPTRESQEYLIERHNEVHSSDCLPA